MIDIRWLPSIGWFLQLSGLLISLDVKAIVIKADRLSRLSFWFWFGGENRWKTAHCLTTVEYSLWRRTSNPNEWHPGIAGYRHVDPCNQVAKNAFRLERFWHLMDDDLFPVAVSSLHPTSRSTFKLGSRTDRMSTLPEFLHCISSLKYKMISGGVDNKGMVYRISPMPSISQVSPLHIHISSYTSSTALWPQISQYPNDILKRCMVDSRVE